MTGEELVYRVNVLEKAKFEYCPLSMTFNKAFKKHEAKSNAKNKSDFIYDSNHAFYRFYKEYDEFKEMSLDSKYNRMEEVNKLLITFKSVKTKKKNGTRLKKDRIMKNIDELYKKCYNAYKKDYKGENGLYKAKKKNFDLKQFKIDDKTDEELKLDEETKEFIEEMKQKQKGVEKKRFSKYFDYEPSTLVGKLISQNT